MVLYVEKVGATQVRVAFVLPGPHACRVDLTVEGGLQWSLEVELQRAADVLEETPHPGDHHVSGAELRLGVPGLEDPGRHQLGPGVAAASGSIRLAWSSAPRA